jgi:hypothetical protein
MGLFKKVFRDRGAPPGPGRHAPVSEFQDSEAAPATTSWRALVRSRREAVHVVLRESMRQHAIPADWIESRLLADVEDARLATFYILLLVRDGHASLQGYAPTFQASFAEAIRRLDPRSKEWLTAICWSFDANPRSALAPTSPNPAAAGFIAADASLVAATPQPAPGEPVTPPQPAQGEPASHELEDDLRALFAIRDAALQAPPRSDS